MDMEIDIGNDLMDILYFGFADDPTNQICVALAQDLDDELDYTYHKVISSPTTSSAIWIDTILNFEDKMRVNNPTVTFTDVINTPIFDWYEGSVINKFFLIMFQPYVLNGTQVTYNGNVIPNNHLQGIYRCIFYLIKCHHLDLNCKDYYETTPTQYLVQLTAWFSKDMPKRLQDFLFSCIWMVKNANIHDTLIEDGFKTIISRYKQRKRAIAIIEDKWLEYAFSPETPIGQKKMQQLADHFYAIK